MEKNLGLSVWIYGEEIWNKVRSFSFMNVDNNLLQQPRNGSHHQHSPCLPPVVDPALKAIVPVPQPEKSCLQETIRFK